MFDEFNTEGDKPFTKLELDQMNTELETRLKSKELNGLPEYERELIISESILNRF